MQTEVPLGDLVYIKHGWAFKGEYFAESGKYIVVTPGNFFEDGGFRLREGKEKYYLDDFPRDYLLEKNDLILAMTEQGEGLLGSPALIPNDNIFLHNQRIGLVQILDTTVLCKEYLYYLFFTSYIRKTIANTSTGTKVRHTSPRGMYKLKINLPPLKTQQKIASLLSNYDKLIENNTQRITLLESMAEELYKEWFVRLRFPGNEDVEVLDGVPEGWEKVILSSFGNITTGKTPSTKNSANFNGDIPFIKTPDFKQGVFLIDTDETLTKDGANSQKNQYIVKNSICVSCIGTIGEIGISTTLSQTNQQINSIELEDENYLEYFYMTIKYLKPLLDSFASSGATMGNLSKSKFSNMKVIKPSYNLIEQYHLVVRSMYQEIELLQYKNQTLKQTRDLLLQRLMSGKLNVEDLDII